MKGSLGCESAEWRKEEQLLPRTNADKSNSLDWHPGAAIRAP
jgi:hypothetical protein